MPSDETTKAYYVQSRATGAAEPEETIVRDVGYDADVTLTIMEGAE